MQRVLSGSERVPDQYPQVQENEGLSLRKPVVMVLSILAAAVAYQNISEKNRKPIVAVILGTGLSYTFGLCNILKGVASILEKEEEETPPPGRFPTTPPRTPPQHYGHESPFSYTQNPNFSPYSLPSAQRSGGSPREVSGLQRNLFPDELGGTPIQKRDPHRPPTPYYASSSPSPTLVGTPPPQTIHYGPSPHLIVPGSQLGGTPAQKRSPLPQQDPPRHPYGTPLQQMAGKPFPASPFSPWGTDQPVMKSGDPAPQGGKGGNRPVQKIDDSWW